VKRRELVAAACGLAAAGLLPARLLARASIPPGIQLYSLRRAMGASVEATLDRVAALGYREVEFAGWFDRSASQVRAALRHAGLAAPAAHVPLEALDPERLPATAAFAREAGHRVLIVAWLPIPLRDSRDAWRRMADRFTGIGHALRAEGLRFAYHNHDFEFAVFDGHVAYHDLVAGTDPALVDFELDLYWATRAGHDPRGLIERFPGRFALVHVKDSAGPPEHRMVDLGEGQIDFPAIFAETERAGIRHAFAEHDNPADPWGFAERGAAYLGRALAGG
jgi:sugar phosphate isomerase/epimerase